MRNKKILFLFLIVFGVLFSNVVSAEIQNDSFEETKSYVFCTCSEKYLGNYSGDKSYGIGNAKTLQQQWDGVINDPNGSKKHTVSTCIDLGCKIQYCKYYVAKSLIGYDSVYLSSCTNYWDENFGNKSDRYEINTDQDSPVYTLVALPDSVKFECLNKECEDSLVIDNGNLTDDKATIKKKDNANIGDYNAEIVLYDWEGTIIGANAVFLRIDVAPCKDKLPSGIDCTKSENTNICKTDCKTGGYCVFEDGVCRDKTSKDVEDEKTSEALPNVDLTWPVIDGGMQFPGEEIKTGFQQINNPDIPTIIGRIIKTILGMTGSIAIAMFVYGGILWMVSAGNSDKTQKSKNILLWSTLGSIVILSSYMIVEFVINSLK